MLYFNNLNGRIGTYIDEYNDQNNEDLDQLRQEDIKRYNDLIANFIKKSSNDGQKSYIATRDDIKEKGQQVPGVVLSDGRIIDGNRRFTAIRELYEKTGDPRFAYFEAAVLPCPEKTDLEGWKEIRRKELWLQYNVNEKKEYNLIPFYRSIYKDTMETTKGFDKEQYLYASGMTESKYKNCVEVIHTMLDYLEWRGKPKAFYILENERLDGPLEEVAKTRKKMSEEEWNLKKDLIYYHITFVDSGDKVRDIRPLLKSLKDDGLLFNNYNQAVDSPQLKLKLIKALSAKDKEKKTSEETQEIKELSNKLQKAFKDAKYEEDKDSIIKEPVELCDAVIEQMNKFDKPLIKQMSPEQKQLVSSKLSEIEKLSSEIRKEIQSE